MIKLSVNVNKIATLRNSRGGKYPDVISICKLVLDAGAHGITIHPREDERHITTRDVSEIKEFIINYNRETGLHKEFNIEGEASERFLKLVEDASPDQATLVPVKPGEITSDHGFNLRDTKEKKALISIIERFKSRSIRVSLFMDTDYTQYEIAKEIKADRIELYTGPFAHAYDQSPEAGKVYFKEYEVAAIRAHELNLGTNAGHDLDTNNLIIFSKLPFLAEVSIGHRLVSQALIDGMEKTIKEYLKILSPKS